MPTGTATGIGVFCQIKEDSRKFMVMIQASLKTADSVLQAEAEALLVAARFGNALKLQHPTFLTDSSTQIGRAHV